jgi:hypothetical protein
MDPILKGKLLREILEKNNLKREIWELVKRNQTT